ncbi:M55 family metallopeptidase [Streptomyces sp. MBT67]|uniref:M55 family metallopeptidase n=1 Tax=unclassified Streptomyces TaxID=2593676 RepID=UPI00190B8570|nr:MULTISPECIES: M55 family metallopeptidase [unclassified Streptomyces]MBK3532127.1 M55 family metallopeptidase [Streptomyces sp. MBT72]MBK3538782.1 M55 family metallopeptidase [Streptomyces sp. MBT67]MBK3553290.1 M55 family metallopeptidase [Streptomyces sp. MBT61]MBK6029035.1 M55 family metallopeptidase [Streptomyces sp. MBT59]
MKALISVDMEGISGIVHSSETNPERYDYQRGRELMTAEANAVIAGVLDAEPTADVLVADAHGTFRNLLPEQLDRRARLVRGKPRALNMLAGLDEETDAALFVGYHVRAGEGPGVLAHTMNGEILDVRVTGRAPDGEVRGTGRAPGEGVRITTHTQGEDVRITTHTPGEGVQVTAPEPGEHSPTTARSLGEIGLNAAMAGHLGVPVVLLSGDDAACAEAAALIPEAVTVPVKEALGMAAAVTLHPEEARDRLRRAAADAVSRRTEIPPLALTGPLDVEVDLASPHTIDLATLVPGVSRTAGARTVAFTAPDYGTAYRLILLLAQLATIRPA